MKRCLNVFIWAGFLVVLAGLFSYLTIFVRFPITRDFPWVNLLLFAAGARLLAVGLKRSLREPQLYRGKISGTILAALSVILIGFFLYGTLYRVRKLPASKGAPQVGQKAPDFTLPDQDGNPVTLSALLHSRASSEADPTHAAVLIFYRGYW